MTATKRDQVRNDRPSQSEIIAIPVAVGATPTDLGVNVAISSGYLDELRDLLGELDLAAVDRVVAALQRAREAGSTIFIAGNGGSAATAAHWVNDLAKATRSSNARHMRVVGLTDNVPWFTALANDEGYERVFSGQIENYARPGDVLIVISASGNSPNILAAMRTARFHDMEVLALLGFDGGAARALADDAVWVRTAPGKYGLVESVHSIVCDLVTTCLVIAGASRSA
jgi:D-sedoheptulose 7-phosphate isomerase